MLNYKAHRIWSIKLILYICIDRHNQKCLNPCKIAKQYKEHTEVRSSSYMWAAFPCVYSGVWRYLQGCKESSPLFVHITHTPIGCTLENLVKIATMKKRIYQNRSIIATTITAATASIILLALQTYTTVNPTHCTAILAVSFLFSFIVTGK